MANPGLLSYAPMEFEIGTAKVTIEFEDENAKYPLALAMLSDEKFARESEASLQTFLRWMWNRIERDDTIDSSIEEVQKQLEQIKEIKQFTTDFTATAITEIQTQPPTPATTIQPATTTRRSLSLSPEAGPPHRRARTTPAPSPAPSRPAPARATPVRRL